MLTSATLTVDLAAIQANYRLLQQRHAAGSCAAVIKADAYGLGMAPVATALQEAGCRTFFVATLEEGIALREAFGQNPIIQSSNHPIIYIFHGPFHGEEAEYLAHDLRPVLNTTAQLTRWAGAIRDLPERQGHAALHVDTGMTRLGLSESELEAAGAPEDLIARCRLALLMSHLACASTPEHPLNAVQQQRFDAIRQRFSTLPASLANSAGHFLDATFHYDMGRPGCALYGITPNTAQPNPMQGVSTLRVPILQLRAIERDGAIGYGATAEVKKGMRVAVTALGYADGLQRIASNQLPGYVGEEKVPMLGRISMDMTCYDVSHIPSAILESDPFITLIGACQPVDSVAEICHTIGYEIFTRLGARVKRQYI